MGFQPYAVLGKDPGAVFSDRGCGPVIVSHLDSAWVAISQLEKMATAIPASVPMMKPFQKSMRSVGMGDISVKSKKAVYLVRKHLVRGGCLGDNL
jgi:hypothetical protein